MYDFSKLIGRIIEKFGTRKEFANALNLSENSLSLKLNGKLGISREDIEEWADLLDIPMCDYGTYFFTKKL